MKTIKKYLIIYDLYAVLLALSFILFEGLSRGNSLLCNGRINYMYVMYNFIGILAFSLLGFVLFSKMYKVTETHLIKGLFFKNKIKWSDIISIEQSNALKINYINRNKKQKTCSIRFWGITNNEKKYISLVSNIIEKYNCYKTEKISESAQEIIEKTHNQMITDIIDNNCKSIKNRGFLLFFILFFVYGLCDNIYDFFTSYNGIQNVYYFFSKEQYHFYIGIHVILLVKIILKTLVAVYLFSRKVFTIKLVQYYYFFEIALIGISRILFVYSAAKFYEPTIFVSFIFTLTGIISSVAFALLVSRYFTTSISVKSTYIK